MPAWAQKARVRFTFVSASTKPIGVVVVAELGAGDLVQTGVPLVEVHLTPYGAQSPPLQTEIGLIMTKPLTGVFCASAVLHTRKAENKIVCAIKPQRGFKFAMVRLPLVKCGKMPQIFRSPVD
jgi:hypothetical protein